MEDGTSIVAIFGVIIPVVVIGLIFYVPYYRKKQASIAKVAYESSLNELKKSPKDAKVREQTTSLGRQYVRSLKIAKKG